MAADNNNWGSDVLAALSKLTDSASLTWEQAKTYAALPGASTCSGSTWLVLEGTGIWPTNKPSGWYYSDGVSWSYLGSYNPVVTGGNVVVSNFPAVQPVSDNGASLTVDGAISVSNFPATQPVSGSVSVSNLPVIQPVSGTFWQSTQPVSALTLPLPSGASTEATLALIKAKTDNLDVALSTRTKPSDSQAVSGTFWQAVQPISGTVAVSGTIPVSGTFFQVTQPISVAGLPLPSGASTEATLALIKAKTDNLDVLLSTRTKPADTQTIVGSVSVSNLPVTQPVSGTFWQATQPVSGPLTDTQLRASALPVSGAFFPATQPISVVSLPLPSGASTEATLALIKAKTDNLDVLLSTRTKPADTQTVSGAVNVSNFPATQPVSGTLTTVEDRATGRTTVLKTGTLVTTAVTADQVILTYTVTAGKTFFLEYLTAVGRLTAIGATASIMGTLSLETPSGTKAWTVTWTNPTISLVQPVVLTFGEPLPIAAGTVIRFVCTPAATTSMTWIGNFGGYEK